MKKSPDTAGATNSVDDSCSEERTQCIPALIPMFTDVNKLIGHNLTSMKSLTQLAPGGELKNAIAAIILKDNAVWGHESNIMPSRTSIQQHEHSMLFIPKREWSRFVGFDYSIGLNAPSQQYICLSSDIVNAQPKIEDILVTYLKHKLEQFVDEGLRMSINDPGVEMIAFMNTSCAQGEILRKDVEKAIKTGITDDAFFGSGSGRRGKDTTNSRKYGQVMIPQGEEAPLISRIGIRAMVVHRRTAAVELVRRPHLKVWSDLYFQYVAFNFLHSLTELARTRRLVRRRRTLIRTLPPDLENPETILDSEQLNAARCLLEEDLSLPDKLFIEPFDFPDNYQQIFSLIYIFQSTNSLKLTGLSMNVHFKHLSNVCLGRILKALFTKQIELPDFT